jgi:hypothetical protein
MVASMRPSTLPAVFLLRPGHQIPDVETVIERHDRYLIVEKPDETFRRAHELDERTDD